MQVKLVLVAACALIDPDGDRPVILIDPHDPEGLDVVLVTEVPARSITVHDAAALAGVRAKSARCSSGPPYGATRSPS